MSTVKINLEPGKYVLAVSGGVDSVVLLDVLSNTAGMEIVVAHFDHEIRDDSALDRQFVAELAEKYGWPFYYAEGNLGPHASEANARAARYSFLGKIQREVKADAIVTAHHQDDLIETAFINLIRGTGRKGLSSLSSREQVQRPLLDISKKDIKKYAREQNLAWREDSTNSDNDYLRNYLRNRILPKLTTEQRKRLTGILDSAGQRNNEIDEILGKLLYGKHIERSWFIALPHAVAREVLSHWLRGHGIAFDRATIERLVVCLKILPVGTQTDIAGGWYFMIGRNDIRLKRHS